MKRRILSIDEYVNEERMFESNLSEYQAIAEAENLREEYQKYFKETLETFGAKSLGELAREDRSNFFKKIKEGWEKGKGRKGTAVSEGELNEGNKKVTVDVDYVCDNQSDCDKMAKKHKVKVVITGDSTANVTGNQKDVIAWMKAAGYEDLEELYPELFETVNEKEITSDEQFKEWATAKLKAMHGDNYDEKKATEVINGLLKKKEDDDLDYGAIIGMLNK